MTKRQTGQTRGARWAGVLLPLLLVSPGSEAATALPDIYVTITGTVIGSAPCTVNGERAIEVNFGSEVMTAKVDGMNYRKPINYTLDCRGATKNSMKLKIQGTPASFNGDVLATTERRNLGILLWGTNQLLKFNDWINFQYPNMPVLMVSPVKQQGTELTTGTFSASATMLVEYQ
ncbi:MULTISPECIES: fimbrial protein [Serratia]|uniref:fimbrial protein n=1 Tax=Serratia TaxID=613 RepID=UPI001F4C14A9|nr:MULTISPECIES: fimbrial protein [Serratia]ULG10889.1 exotoxin [Serratia entomophila]CAI1948860.1 putative minor fimbrial subunit StfE [Serratia quinivorans]CAI2158839.1 putative minor fimbrial subunit StfE [Serratia quinivorans]